MKNPTAAVIPAPLLSFPRKRESIYEIPVFTGMTYCVDKALFIQQRQLPFEIFSHNFIVK
jgi:hypothetical protein